MRNHHQHHHRCLALRCLAFSRIVIHGIGKAAPLMSAFSASPERVFPSVTQSLRHVWIISVGGGKLLIPWHLHIYSFGCGGSRSAWKISRLGRWHTPLSVEACRTIALLGSGYEVRGVEKCQSAVEWMIGDGFLVLQTTAPCDSFCYRHAWLSVNS